MRDWSLFQAQMSVLAMHVVRESQPLFLFLSSLSRIFVPQSKFFLGKSEIFLGEKTTMVAFCRRLFVVVEAY